MKNNTRLVSEAHGGFTLVETLVAVAIISLAVSGVFFSMHGSIIAARTARDQLSASLLAQKSIEYVRLLRDNAYLQRYATGDPNASTNAWSDFVNSISDIAPPPCESDACSHFSRTLTVSVVSATDVRVVAGVAWQYHAVPYAVTITDMLTPWQ